MYAYNIHIDSIYVVSYSHYYDIGPIAICNIPVYFEYYNNNTILDYNTLFKYCIDKYNRRRYYIVNINIYIYRDLLHHSVSIYL